MNANAEIAQLAAGQASMMLMESLLLDLIGKKVFAPEELAETIQAVIDAKRQLISDGVEKDVAECALGLLATLHNSVLAAKRDAPANPAAP